LGTVAEARRAVDACGDELVAAKAAFEQLRSGTPDIAAEVAIADNRAVAASNAVLAEPLGLWLAKAKQARADLLVATRVLDVITDDADLDAGLRDPRLDDVARYRARAERIAPLGALLDETRRFLMNVQGDVDETEARAAVQAWRSFRMRLREDADVEMPSSAPFR
jgi:hypothetical protein